METMIPATLQDNADESLDVARLGAQLHEMTALYGQSRERIAQLEEQISQLQRRLFGARSERYEANQFVMDLILKAGESASPAAPDPVVDVKATQRRKATPHGRTEIPANLEREDILLDLAEEQKVDAEGCPLVKLREEISEKIAWRPGCWHVKRYIRPVYVPADRKSDMGVVCMPMPDSPIEKCKADNSVLALVAIHKWADHLPVYRQREIFIREGLEIASSTLDAWAIEPILACQRLYEELKKKVLSCPVVHTDDSPVDLQVPGRGKAKEGRLWVYLAGVGTPLRFFDFSSDRCKERPAGILENFEGFLQADA